MVDGHGSLVFQSRFQRAHVEVVTEAVDANAASPLAALKKDAVVMGAEQTVAGTGWLPACLRINTAQTRQTNAAADDTGRVPGEPALTA